jgi:aryl-alcohol dehydrogenase-like predicted oxidoreductase
MNTHAADSTPAGPDATPQRAGARIGLGCVTFGREIDRAAAFAVMDHAHGRGVAFFDTAAAYGQGASEAIVGDWLEARPGAAAGIVVATKVLPPYTPEGITAAVRGSLARLRRPAVDVLFLHRWDATVESPGCLEALDGLVRTGMVRALGASNFNAGQLAAALQVQQARGLAPFRYLQNNHNYAVRDVDDALQTVCDRHGVAVITYSPLGAGFLTGKHRHGVPPGSRFDLIPGHQGVYFHDVAYRRLARLEAVAGRTGRTMVELALDWALHRPGTAVVLIGGRTPAHVDQAFAARECVAAAARGELDGGE